MTNYGFEKPTDDAVSTEGGPPGDGAISSIFIVGAQDGHTTARYFERAAAELHIRCHYVSTRFDPRCVSPRDLILAIDPVPILPIGIERAPCPTMLYLIDVHQDLTSRLALCPLFDAVYIAQPDYRKHFIDAGYAAVEWLPLACDPSIHARPSSIRDLDVGFVGKLGNPGTSRRSILTAVLETFPGNDVGRFHPPADMAAIYSRSKIVINASINGDVNMRVFEAMASGALLVTDRIANGQARLFEEGRHFVGYSTPAEAVAAIRYYLANDAERQGIAAEGRAFALSRHTYRRRLELLLSHAARIQGRAPARVMSARDLLGVYTALASRGPPADALRLTLSRGPSLATLVAMATSTARAANRRFHLTRNARRSAVARRAGRAAMPRRPY